MIAFERISFVERLMMLWPPYRKKKDQELEDAIRFLVENPMESCFIEGHYIPNGHGNSRGV